MLTLDHIVIATADLDRGTEWLAMHLGCGPEGGGKHPLFGTHNALWPLGEAYLELIAMDPGAPEPDRPRLFELDTPAMKARIADTPRLVHWVLGTQDADAALSGLAYDPGPPVAMTRGNLHWRLTVRDDGSMAGGGCLPSIVEWPMDVTRPPQAMPDRGLKLEVFDITGDDTLCRAVPRLAPVRTLTGERALGARIRCQDGSTFAISDQT